MAKEVFLKDTDYVLMLKLYLNQILILAKRRMLHQGLNIPTPINTNDSLVVRFKQLVKENFAFKRDLDYYAHELAVSKKTLIRIIKEKIGKTPTLFIKNILLAEAQNLLIYTELSISEIAHQLQFHDPSHFVRFFKKEVSLTPLEYRIKYQRNVN